ncbi:hypothetical protein RHGRI_025019 [Rhododendron griersonianum]|uniref:GATA transcription factor n=1 Tax=Rhododendron griersonianum TaxID=479676 RepID=A0AAV6J9A3_9ERIC|nr:hypothetical protein RHGRI_025019 [Rhododendron griersonianum]
MEVPEYFTDAYFSAGNCYYDKKPAENVAINHHFTVDDLLDFSKADEVMATEGVFDNVKVNSAESSGVTVVDSCNSSVSGGDAQFSGGFADGHFSGELCVPYDDLAELEWLSNFVEDSFSSDEFQNHLHLISPANNPPHIANSSSHIPPRAHAPPIFPSDVSVPGKARSKRSRAAPCDWSSRLLLLSSPASPELIKTTAPSKKRDVNEPVGRKCLHCGSEKTPQWRTGPMGPKTLCNACGVRFKSGRLVPEYRPAASPSFVSAKHSNSHRKVLELRRQKEFQMQQQQQQFVSQSSIFGASNGGDRYLIHHRGGPDYGHMI